MKWKGRAGSKNVEDRRGRGVGGPVLAGGGIGGLLIVLLITFLGGDPGAILGGEGGGDSSSEPYVASEREEELADFVSVVLADTEEVWAEVFAEEGMEYVEPTLVLFSGSVQSACGMAGAATGPFYCPADSKLYIDLSFYDELERQFNAPGDFAMAYVVAHEVGHHVQSLLGVLGDVQQARNQLSETEYNQLQVRLELQADYLSGVWAHHAQGMGYLEEGDLVEALNAASAVGDDTIQKRTRGYAVPESFTHGTSEQRKEWFYKGFRAGDLNSGNTFDAPEL
ncbi:zinc metallopeptidase [Planococcus sp. CP5-4]|uniref:KPN_02809 family neutral zinc metallopeptidase n=1 Tax=unclassified Planococcus (in: firmicutes) TaxID=2662419 RepID=UPI001C247974|nr:MULTISPECIES: neutral zinc metallopeptidase [unclassified Planococcus (in: firmicutes)]MBU9673291.1 zinc metallopeptidase [Planococcus sp. CP5-4_YE]MBV0908385.1 zinc metallopeptidase [Planococcus sp. CP5-4_UN]MBW6062599.1 zinc metallopeptidase [Planococcus sp. CP5-4]